MRTPMSSLDHTRRDFLYSLGALSAAGVSSRILGTSHNDVESKPNVSRGLAAPDDFAFAPGLVYLQTGSLGPTPRPVMERTIATWKQLELDPTAYGYGEHEHAMDDVRAQAAAFLHCKTEELVLTRSTTEGHELGRAGPHVRRRRPRAHHRPGASRRTRVLGLRRAALRCHPRRRRHSAGRERRRRSSIECAKLITPRTRVLSFSHLLSSTGLRMPVAELSALARSRGCIAVVDGAQAVGGIAVDVKALGCHAYATSGHKWLLAPKGTGLLYLSEELGQTTIDPIALAGRTRGVLGRHRA